MPATTPSAAAGAVLERPAAGSEAALFAKIGRRLIPFLCLLYVVNYLDRTNIAMAKLQMTRETGLTDAAYGFGAGLFFIGYFLFELPSNLILERVGARLWMTRIMVSWGVVSAAMMFAKTSWTFYALRFALGLAEAGFFPGIVLYLTYWYPQRRRAAVMAAFLTSTALSGVIGSPLGGLLLRLDGYAGLHGWQWMFLLEGLLPIGLGACILWLLPDRPAAARWLSDGEKARLDEILANDPYRQTRAGHDHLTDLRSALLHRRLWQLASLYFTLVMGLYGISFYVPELVKAVVGDAAGTVRIGLLAAVPYLVSVVGMVVIGRHADRTGERRKHIAACAAGAAVGMAATWALLAAGTSSVVLIQIALCVSAVGIYAVLGPFWALATAYLRGTSAAGGIAVVNSVGCLAGFVAPSIIGYVKQTTGGYTGLLAVSVSLAVGAGIVTCLPRPVEE